MWSEKPAEEWLSGLRLDQIEFGKITDANARAYCRILRTPFSQQFLGKQKSGRSVRAGIHRPIFGIQHRYWAQIENNFQRIRRIKADLTVACREISADECHGLLRRSSSLNGRTASLKVNRSPTLDSLAV
ncbi:MAG: hypothetical protein DWH78_05620 [Planctomycetota bacterium]|nr:MAG: hypothetical protein DWH78_05620 [Planctomycetota bacterium]